MQSLFLLRRGLYRLDLIENKFRNKKSNSIVALNKNYNEITGAVSGKIVLVMPVVPGFWS